MLARLDQRRTASTHSPSGRAIGPLVAKLRTTTSQLGRRAISERSSATAASVAPGPAVLQLGRSADVLAGKVLEGAIDRPERSRRIASEELLDREVETGKGVGRVQQLGQLTERVVIPINPKVYDGAGTDLFRRSALNDQKRRGHPALASPPASSPATRAARSLRAKGPAELSNADAIGGHTSGELIMLACTAKPSPITCPA